MYSVEADKNKITKNPVLIKWIDITAWSGWNQELIDDNKDEPWEFTTVGFIVNEKEHTLTVSDCYPEIGNVTVYPKGCILSITELSTKEE